MKAGVRRELECGGSDELGYALCILEEMSGEPDRG